MSLWICSKWNEKPTDQEKWEVIFEDEVEYEVKFRDGSIESHWLPKSDYRPCEPPAPPERWEDVTEQCEICWDRINMKLTRIDLPSTALPTGYRLRKVQLETRHTCGKTLANIVWAFVVEKKVTA